MKRFVFALSAGFLILSLTGCSLPKATPQITPLNTPASNPLATPQATSTLIGSVPTPGPSPTGGLPGTPGGTYAVVLVAPGDVLNIRSGPGVDNPVIGSFAPTVTDIIRTGPATPSGGDVWVQVQVPGGSLGWVDSIYLTEYVPPAVFCSDTRVTGLITSLGEAFTANDGVLLASLVSPAHGMTVYLHRLAYPIPFMASDARWVFESTFVHDWGPVPANGMETSGSFHDTVLPQLLQVFNASYTLQCDSPGLAGTYTPRPWPEEYTNINYYGIYRPISSLDTLDWQIWLAGIEYSQGTPSLFSLINFTWEP